MNASASGIDKAQHICQQAARLFARYGFEGVTMRHIAEASGVTMATLYYHFASKEELHDEVTQLKFSEFHDSVVAQWRLAETRCPSILIGLVFDEALREPTFFLLMQHELHHFDEGPRYLHSRKRYRRLYALLKESLEQRPGRVAEDSEVFILAALITGLLELIHADQRAAGASRADFIAAQRAAIIAHVHRSFD